jgi:hypothetical protein
MPPPLRYQGRRGFGNEQEMWSRKVRLIAQSQAIDVCATCPYLPLFVKRAKFLS